MVIYEKGKTVGRKFLVAGKGGFNLSHNLGMGELIKKYEPSEFMAPALRSFSAQNLQEWYNALGVSTFVGSSNKIFPEKGISPADVLKKIVAKLKRQKVEFKLEHEFVGFTDFEIPLIKSNSGIEEIKADFYIFALGGASWKVTGSDGSWLQLFNDINVETLPFEASNSGLEINWPKPILDFHTGKPLKNISISHNDFRQKGEALISTYGLEGNAVYPVSSKVRESLKHSTAVHIHLDLKPNQTLEQLLVKVKNAKPSNYFERLHLGKTKMALLKSLTTKEQFLDPVEFVKSVKSLPIKASSLRPIEESISTVGGISINALSSVFSLKNHPHIFCIGEMVNWDAPTGGFLLQGCFSMGFYTGTEILNLCDSSTQNIG